MALQRRRFPEIKLATEQLLDALVADGRATYRRRPSLVAVRDWRSLSGSEQRQIVEARSQARARLQRPGSAPKRSSSAATKAAPIHRKTPNERRLERRGAYLKRWTGYGNAFGSGRTARIEAYNYWHMPRRVTMTLALATAGALVAAGVRWRLGVGLAVGLVVVSLVVERALVRRRAIGLSRAFALAEEQSRHIPALLRERVLAHDGRRCRRCGSTSDLSVDHVVPYSRGGSTDFTNLRTLCMPCNIKKGNRRPSRITRFRSQHRRNRAPSR